jgi:hypothetical protein
MFIPIGHDGPPQETPWMTMLIIGVCVVLQLLSSLDSSITSKVDLFCKSALGRNVTATLTDIGLKPDLFEEDCTAAVGAILTGKAQTLIEAARLWAAVAAST